MTDKQIISNGYNSLARDCSSELDTPLTTQIIIDGVDVSGCRFYDGEFEYSCQCSCTICERNQEDCYYKQLKRKEQECEAYKIEADEGKEINAELKAENDELKTMLKDLSYESQKFCYQIEEQTKQLEPFKDEYFKGLDNVVIAELAKKSIRITAENSKLEQTLTEIKEIAERCGKRIPLFEIDEIAEDLKQILQKISEVEDE